VTATFAATARTGRGGAVLPALVACGVADAAAREGVAPETVRLLATTPGATAPGYRIVLVANNARYEYDGGRDCIVMAPRESHPSVRVAGHAETGPLARGIGARQAVAPPRTSSQVPSLEPLPTVGMAPADAEPARRAAPPEAPSPAEGDRYGAAAPAHAPLAFRLVGARVEQVEAAQDSFYRRHLGYEGPRRASASDGR